MTPPEPPPPEPQQPEPPQQPPPPSGEAGYEEFWAAAERRGRRRHGEPAGPDADGAPGLVSRWAAAGLLRVRVGFQRLGGMPVEGWVSLAVVASCVAFVVYHLGHTLLLENTTPAGGDMGAHVWGPAFLRDELLPQARLTGWSPDWYAGLPAYHFYMVPPMLAIALLSYVLPYGIAFKLVAVSGVVTMPISAWAFGRLARLPFPGPALLAAGVTAFLFDRGFSIYGGNMASTLAGEFAFSISLSLALLYLGVVAHALHTGRCRATAAVLLALVGLTHLIPTFFALVATAVLFAAYPGAAPRYRRLARAAAAPGLIATAVIGLVALWPVVAGWASGGSPSRPLPDDVLIILAGVVGVAALVWFALAPGRARWWWLLTTMPVAALLSAFWIVPFYLRRGYMNDMGWEKKTNFETLLWDRSIDTPGMGLDSGLVDHPPLQWVIGLAIVGVLLSLINRRRLGIVLAVVAVIAALAFWGVPQGRLWNARLTPFYYLCLYLLAAIGVSEFGRVIASLVARDVRRPLRSVRWATAVGGLAVVLVVLGLPLRSLPFGTTEGGRYEWLGLSTTDSSFVPSWARWNFAGYENKPAWPEYREIMATMDEVGAEVGCGRAMWEHESQHDRYGTPMAMMLLPFWTDGCIGSMEGLYFETSATTPFHFLNQDKLSIEPSNAQREMPYRPSPPSEEDFDQGIVDLQLFGVRYYLAISQHLQDLADDHPDLDEIATSGPWIVYELSDSPLVEGLAFQPVVVEGADAGGEVWTELAVEWFDDREQWPVPIAADGPDEWERVWLGDPPILPPDEPGASAHALEGADAVALPEVEVDEVHEGVDAISFRVDQTGVPVLVKASYFPNWEVDGADGPWQITPNLMVVVPTAEDGQVVLRYGWTAPDLGGWALTGLGVLGVIVLWRRPGLVVGAPWWLWPRRSPSSSAPSEPPAAPVPHARPEAPSGATGSERRG